jgi:SAM-dependent methyltransferase
MAMGTDHEYDAIAASYDSDPFSLIGDSRELALAQLGDRVRGAGAPRLLDIGCGTGLLLGRLRELAPEAQLFGLEPSAEMRRVAKQRAGLEIAAGGSDDLCTLYEAASFDGVALHYILAYVERDRVFADIARLLRPGGWFSLVTSTHESHAGLMEIGRALHTIEDPLERLTTPKDLDDAVGAVEAAGLRCVAAESFIRDVTFANFAELRHFGVNVGWFVQFADVLDALDRLPGFHDRFPVTSRHVSAVVTAVKP